MVRINAKAEYIKSNPAEIWWCNSHRRRATYMKAPNFNRPLANYHCCDPALGGITIPCVCVELTGKVELVG